MHPGKQIRLNRIFRRDGRSVVVAMDHGLPGVTPLAGLQDPATLLAQVEAGGADAILTTPGIAGHFSPQIGRLGLILRLDGAATMLGNGSGAMRLIATVEDALALGADAVAVMGFCGTEDEANSLEILGHVAGECRRLGMPLLAEMLPLGYGASPSLTQLVQAARIGAEMGADIIKLPYLGPTQGYQSVIDTCFVPVLVLGGGAKDEASVLEDIRQAMSAGAAGVAIGRNVWTQTDATSITQTIVRTVHGEERS